MRGLFQWLLLVVVLAGGCSGSVPAESSATVATSQPAPRAEATHLVSYSGGARPDQPLPMVILIHGYGGTPDKMLQSFGVIDTPARIVSLRGQANQRRGYFWFPVNVDDPDVPALAVDLRRVGGNLSREIQDLKRQYPTQGLPIVLGFSQGAMIAMELGLTVPHELGAAIVVAGYYPPQLFPASPSEANGTHLYALHGTADDVLPIEHMREAIAHLRRTKYTIDYREVEGMGHAVDGPSLRALLKVLRREAARQTELGQAGHP